MISLKLPKVGKVFLDILSPERLHPILWSENSISFSSKDVLYIANIPVPSGKGSMYNNYLYKVQNFFENTPYMKHEVNNLSKVQQNFFYSLLIRNPFKFDGNDVPIDKQYYYLMHSALETYSKLKESKYLKDFSNKEIYEQLSSMKTLNPYPIEENIYDSNQRDKHIWYVLTELMKYNIIGDKNG